MRKPNLIYILADDMGYGDVSFLNPRAPFRTPAFDRLAREGAWFTDAHSSSAVCTPSRYSILTGRYNWRSWLKWSVLGGYGPPMLEEGRETLASLLRGQGYHTSCIGKWHLGMDWGGLPERSREEAPGNFETNPGVDFTQPIRRGPLDCGFDRFFGVSGSLDLPPYVFIEDDRVQCVPEVETENTDYMGFWRRGPAAPDFRHEDALEILLQRTLDTIEAQQGGPFFIYFPLTAPHTPILPPARFQGASGTNAYGDFVLACDEVVERILAQLERLGIADDTIVVMTSDNGCSPRADFETLARCGHFPNHVFRGHKSQIYEGGHRVPFLIRWPKGIAPDTRVDEPVCLSDMMATLAELLDIPLSADAGEDSFSFLPTLTGWRSDWPRRESMVHHSMLGAFSIRRGNWKLEMCRGGGGWNEPKPGRDDREGPAVQLYDLQMDLGETRNLIDRHPAVAAELEAELMAIIRKGRSTPGPDFPDPNPQWLRDYLPKRD